MLLVESLKGRHLLQGSVDSLLLGVESLLLGLVVESLLLVVSQLSIPDVF